MIIVKLIFLRIEVENMSINLVGLIMRLKYIGQINIDDKILFVDNKYIFCRYEKSEAYEKKGDRNPRTLIFIVKQLINANKLNHSTKLTAQIVTVLVCCYSKTYYYFNNER